jgi:hypothetical protein
MIKKNNKIGFTLTSFWSPNFSFFRCDKHNVVISKVHYESIIFFKFIKKIMMISIKGYENMNNLKIDNVNFQYGFKFYVCM